MMPARCEGGATARGAIRIYLDERSPRTSSQLGETCREYWAKYSLHLNKNARDPADADAAFGGGGSPTSGNPGASGLALLAFLAISCPAAAAPLEHRGHRCGEARKSV